MKRASILTVLLFAPALLAAQATQEPGTKIIPVPDTRLPLKHAPKPTTAAITAQDLMTRLYIFADDSMMGREAGTLGNVKGTTYIAREVERIGLVPAGDDGTYFQTLPLKSRVVEVASTLTAGGNALTFGTEWAGSGNASVSLSNVPIVYGGELGDSANLIDAAAAAGKFVVFSPGRRLRFRGLSSVAPEAAAAAIIVPQQLLGFLTRPSTFVDDPSDNAGSGGASIFLTESAAAKLFDQPLGALRAGAAGKTVSLDLKMQIEPIPFPARNVVAILPGSDPRLKNQYVAIGAHNDHIGLASRPVDHDSLRIFNHIVRPGGAEDGRRQATPEQQAEVNELLAKWRSEHPNATRLDSIDNGADDDGSGSVSALEVAQYVKSVRPAPRRSILFVWHVGEEKGLWGSEYFTDHPSVPRDSIVAQLNMDMVGRGDAWDVTGHAADGEALYGGPDYLQLVGSRRLSTELGDIVEQVNHADGHELHFDYALDANGHPANIYCRSDHYEYARWGIPIVFFTTGVHSDYHQVTDEPEYIDYEHMARVDKLVADVAIHVANLDHRVVVDQPKPDPHGGCRQ